MIDFVSRAGKGAETRELDEASRYPASKPADHDQDAEI